MSWNYANAKQLQLGPNIFGKHLQFYHEYKVKSL